MPPLSPVIRNLMLVCVAVYCAQLLFGPSFGDALALWPIGSGHFWPWQLVTYGFLHGGEVHLFFNMLGLWMFGSELELLWGQKRFLIFMAAGLLTAAITQLIVSALLGLNAHVVGISGALFALLLAYALVFPERRFDLIGFLPMLLMMIPSAIFNVAGMVLFFLMLTNRNALPIRPIPIPAMAMVVAYGVIELTLGVLGHDGIAHFAHLGGMLGGFAMIRYWRWKPPFGRRRR
jgi:membrane associated rhomboid family serine protease